MIFTNPPPEIFDYNWIRNMILDDPRSLYKEKVDNIWVTKLRIPNGVQSNMSHTNWENVFSLIALGMEVLGAKLFSNEMIWNDIKNIEIPNTWPDWSVTEEESGGEVTRAKLLFEYFYTVRSTVDSTKCVFRWQQFHGAGIPIVDNEYIPHNYISLSNDLLSKIRSLFGDNFFSMSEAKVWRDTNIPQE